MTKNISRFIRQSFLLFFFPIALNGLCESTQTADYGVKTKYVLNQPIQFPDFELTFSGTRKVTPEQYPRGFTLFDFLIQNQSEQKTVSWSAGTGDIGPQPFEFNSQKFILELKYSDISGPLAQDELIVTKVEGSQKYNGIAFTASLAKTPMEVNLSFTNISQNDIYFFFSDCPVEFLYFSLYDVSGNQVYVQPTPMHASACNPSNLTILKPGNTYSASEKISQWGQPPKGHYLIQYHFKIPSYWAEPHYQRIFRGLFMGHEEDYWRGHLISDRIPIDIE